MNVPCRICAAASEPFASGRVLNRYEISYYRCDRCGFVQTETPYWLPESYSSAINSCDVGLVGRNLDLRKKTAAVLLSFFDCDGKFLDYGGGYGLFVRLMRDAGFDFMRSDKHCENIFAADLEAELGDGARYELISAFEVFEHLENPWEEIDKMLAQTRSILFTTELMPDTLPRPGQWWYYIPEYGQHISFYTSDTLKYIAASASLNLYSDGRFFHLLTDKKISQLAFKVVCRKNVSAAIAALSRRRSLVADDYRRITGKHFG